MQTLPESGFASLGLSPQILAILEKIGFTVPTPIQQKAIPIVVTGQDVIGIAQTGTGKTLAFGLPTIQHLLKNQDRALILVPTRELALQVEENIRAITHHMQPGLRSRSIIGGEPIFRQIRDLKHTPQVIVATPGRLADHLKQKTVELSKVKILILDEADRMFDMGFAPQIKNIMQHVPAIRQTLLFSATMSPEVRTLASTYMKNPVSVEVANPGTSAELITQELCYVRKEEKFDVLSKLLKDHTGTVLVFSRTKHGAAKLAHNLHVAGNTVVEIHSNRSLNQRKHALEGFKSGKYRILVATDIAARGIDVQNIQLVVNYDLPDASEDYVHRIGRTGRAGTTGLAISLATLDQVKDVKAIEKLMKRPLPLSEHSLKPSESQLGTIPARPTSFVSRGFQQRRPHPPRSRGGRR